MKVMASAKQWADNEPFDFARPTVKIWPDLVEAAMAQVNVFRAHMNPGEAVDA